MSAESKATAFESLCERLLELYCTCAGSDRLCTRTARVEVWTPNSARRTRRRFFLRLDVGGVPRLVAKVPLVGSDPKLRREATVLGLLDEDLPVHRPRLVAPLEDGFVMTYLPGSDLPDVLDGPLTAERLSRVLSPVVDAVADLHLTSTIGSDRGRGRVAALQYVTDPPTGQPHLDEALDAALVAPTHGDLGPWNVRFEPASGRVLILDWEDYRPAGIAALDVLNLLLTCGLLAFPDYRSRGFDWLYGQMFLSANWWRGVLVQCVMRYCARTGQDPRQIFDLTPLFCLWLITRIEAEGRDSGSLFYGTFLRRYLDGRPAWVAAL
jgi:Phosphotransferase enzyme family